MLEHALAGRAGGRPLPEAVGPCTRAFRARDSERSAPVLARSTPPATSAVAADGKTFGRYLEAQGGERPAASEGGPITMAANLN